MKDIILFLENNWLTIVSVVIFILSFILQLFKKKPIEVNKTILENVLTLVPHYVSYYEKFYGQGHGSQKRGSVVTAVMREIERCYALDDRQRSWYQQVIKLYIEEILSCPSKKGGEK